ncbi:MAG: LacI family DNA-binding transcriptional regulator [Clostridia bacterium]|nr:LacI family DNA-binding transcriptional regulator [Clostridia bacterium]
MTIYDIAKIAGVSPGTVSRVVNKKPGVKQSTRERIERLLEEHHYTPDLNARALVMQNSRMIGIVTDDLVTHRLGNVLYSVIRELMQNGYTCFIQYTGKDNTVAQALTELASRRVLGALLLGVTFMNRDEISQAISRCLPDIPVVMVNQATDFGMSNVYCVGVDEKDAFWRCVRMLSERGRKQMALVIDAGRISTKIIRSGFEAGIRDFGVQGRVYEGIPATGPEGEAVLRRIMEEEPATDAVLCAQDMLAIGVLHAAQDMGLDVPERLSVMGEDNSRLCEACRPRLSSLDTIIPAVAISSARTLMDALEGKPVAHRMILNMEICERETT